LEFTTAAAAWRAVRRTRPLRTRPLTDICAVGKAHAMQPSGAGLKPATIQWRFQADCSCGTRQALKGSFRRNGQKARQRRCPEMRSMSNGETADSRKRQTFVGMSHDVSSTVRPNFTIERRGRKGRKGRQFFLAAFAAFAFQVGLSSSGSPRFHVFCRRERRAREAIGETRLVDLTAPLAHDDHLENVAAHERVHHARRNDIDQEGDCAVCSSRADVLGDRRAVEPLW
jgi:hypothetical protein